MEQNPDKVTLDDSDPGGRTSSSASPPGITLDDVEVMLWRSLGLKETQLVDNVLKVVQAYGDARERAGDVKAEWRKAVENPGTPTKYGVYLPASDVSTMTSNQAKELQEALEQLKDDPAWKVNVRFPAITETTGVMSCGPLPRPSGEWSGAAVCGPLPVPVDETGWPFNLVDDEDRDTHKEGHPPYARDGHYAKEGHPSFSGSVNSSSPFSPDIPESDDLETEKDFFGMLYAVVEESKTGTVTEPEPREDEAEMLSCKKCGKSKQAEHFARDRSRKRGRRWNCRLCEADMRRGKAMGRAKPKVFQE